MRPRPTPTKNLGPTGDGSGAAAIIEAHIKNTAPVTRRRLITRLAAFGGCVLAAPGLLPVVVGPAAQAAVIPENDPRLNVATIFYDSPYGRMSAYTVRLKDGGRQPSILVIHDDKGLTPQVEEIVRKLAAAGFYAIAVDALSPLGGTPAEDGKAPAEIAKLDEKRTTEAFVTAIRWLKTNLNTTEKIGCMGFGWGGGLANRLATHVPEVATTVVYYGASPDLAKVPDIKSAMLLHYAADDPKVNAGATAYVAALNAANVTQRVFRYPGTKAGFANSALPKRYAKEAASLAWARSLAFFRTMLS